MALVIVHQMRIREMWIRFAMGGFRDGVIAAIHANCEEEELNGLLIRMVDWEEQYMLFEGEGDVKTVEDEV